MTAQRIAFGVAKQHLERRERDLAVEWLDKAFYLLPKKDQIELLIGAIIVGNMMLKIGYFAEPFAPGVKPLSLPILAGSGEFATYNDVLIVARQTANDVQAHSFVIEWPGGTSDRYIRNGDVWSRLDA
jgi:hypothetical protein